MTEISSTGGVLGAIIAKLMLERGVPAGGKVGMVGTEVLTSAGYAAANRELAGFQLVDFDEGYRAVTDRKRPREVLIVGRALKIAQAAVAAGEAAFAKGASTASAYVEAETVRYAEAGSAFEPARSKSDTYCP